jgi:hypothetical protein
MIRRPAVVSFEALLSPHLNLSSKLEEISRIYSLPALYPRKWISFTPKVNCDSTFRVMQFNILAEGLSAHPQAVPPFNSSNGYPDPEPSSCGDFDLDENASVIFNFEGCRRWRVLEEILNVSPDILALEECDHFDDFFLPILESLGYSVCPSLSLSNPALPWPPLTISLSLSIFLSLSVSLSPPLSLGTISTKILLPRSSFWLFQ